MDIPSYLKQYTKQSIEQVITERDKAIAQRCREVGKGKTSQETGWSMPVVIRACEENGVPANKRGRKPNYSKNFEVVEIAKELPRNITEKSPIFYSKSIQGSILESDPKFSNESILLDFEKISDELKRCNSTQFEQAVRECTSEDDFRNLFFGIQPPRDKIHTNRKKPKNLFDGIHVEQPEVLPPNSEKIELSLGLFAIVDSDMVPILKRFTWSAKPDYRMVYAVSTDRNVVQFKMHKFVLGLPNGSKHIVDHINHNAIDNRRCNLRVVGADVNGENRHDHDKKTSRFYGVYWNTGSWTATIKDAEGKAIKTNFDSEVEAARYYDQLVKIHRKPGWKTNESEGLFSTEILAEEKTT